MEPNKQQMGVYADYYTVIPMIQMSYYSMLDYFEKYYYLLLTGKKQTIQAMQLKSLLQAKLLKMSTMLWNYKSTQEKKEKTYKLMKAEYDLKSVFYIMHRAETEVLKLSWPTLLMCKHALVDAHFNLGLSNIEVDKAQENFYNPSTTWTG